jgi:integrase
MSTADRRAFGSVRVLKSGRVQARFFGPDGLRRSAPKTFESKAAAKHWLALCEADMLRGTWSDPHERGEALATYAARWIRERPGLSERTARLYEGLLRLHIAPVLGGKDIRRLTPPMVRSWRQGLIDGGVGASTVAKAYRLLRTILNTAFDDEVIRRNPCRIKGAAVEKPKERPVLTLAEVQLLAAAIDPRYRAFVLLAVFGSLRWGELMGLRRSDFDFSAGVVRIERAVSEIGARQVIKKPKTAAGVRTIALPRWLTPELRRHFDTYAEPGQDGRVFVGPKGATPLRPNFSSVWKRALKKAELSGIHIHDLRHAGNHFAAMTGASTRELMGRMGHASMDAALIYQHRTADRDRAIADAIDVMLTGLIAAPETLVGSGVIESVGDNQGHMEGTPADQ